MEYTESENSEKSLEDNKVKEKNANVRGEERQDARSQEAGRNDSAGERSTSEEVSRKIKEILRRSSVERRSKSVARSGRSGRVEQKETAEAFEGRVRDEGYMYVEINGVALAYKHAPQSEWNENAKEAAENLEGLGITVIVFEGNLLSNNRGVTEILTEAATAGTGDMLTVFVSSELSVDGMETAYHEAFHASKRMNRGATLHYRMRDIIAGGVNVESEDFNEFVSYIAELYSYEVKHDELNRFATEVTEEFYAWYIGGIYANENTHNADIRSYIEGFSNSDKVKAQLDAVFAEIRSGVSNQTPVSKGTAPNTLNVQNTEANAEKNTDTVDGVNFSLKDSKENVKKRFYSQIDNWDGETIGFSFVLGTTSEALKEAGVPDKQIRWDASKIKKLLKDHDGMTIDLVKQIPDLLDNPVVVIDSKKNLDSRIVMGDLYDDNGKLVTVVLLLTPTSKKGNQLNLIKVSSAQGRSHIESLFRYDDGIIVNIRFVDKKRIHSWLNVNRLQLPLHSSNLDSTSSIAQKTKVVNSQNSLKSPSQKIQALNRDLENVGLGIGFMLWCLACIWLWLAIFIPQYIVAKI